MTGPFPRDRPHNYAQIGAEIVRDGLIGPHIFTITDHGDVGRTPGIAEAVDMDRSLQSLEIADAQHRVAQVFAGRAPLERGDQHGGGIIAGNARKAGFELVTLEEQPPESDIRLLLALAVDELRG